MLHQAASSKWSPALKPVVIKKILTHQKKMDASKKSIQLPVYRAPPQTGLFN